MVASPAAPRVAPGAPTNARVSSPVEVSSHANGAPREITVTVTFTPPANQGSGITRYVLTGEMLFQGTGSPIRTVQGQVAGSASSGPVTFVFGTTQGFGLGDGGFIRWRLVAQGPGGSSGPATVAANAPSLVGASTTDAYHLLWSAGVRVFTAIGGGCASETVCAQSASGPMASGGTVTITHP